MQRPLRHWCTRLVVPAALLIIGAAGLSAAFTLALDASPRLRHAIEARLVSAFGTPATIGHIALSWRHVVPEIALRNVALRDTSGQPTLEIARLRVMPDYLALLHGTLRPARVTLVGLHATLDVNGAGYLSLRGLGHHAEPSAQLLAGLEHAVIEDSSITLVDARLAPPARVFRIDGRIARTTSNDPPDYRLEFAITPPARVARRLSLAAQLHVAQPGGGWGGTWHATLHDLRAAPYLDAWLGGDRHVAFGRGQVEARGRIVDGQLATATVRFSAAGVIATQASHVLATLRTLAVRANWTRQAGGWQIELPQCVGEGDDGTRFDLAPATLEATVEDARPTYRLQLARLPVSPLLPWLKLGRDAGRLDLPPGLSGTLDAPRATFQPATPLQPARHALTAQVEDLGWHARGVLPGVAALSGALQADDDGGRFTPDGGFTLAWPAHFTAPVTLAGLGGAITWQRTDSGAWQIDAPAIDAVVDGARAQGTLLFRTPAPDHAAPAHLDLDLQLSTVDATRLKPLMPSTWSPQLRAWLAGALVTVPVTGGRLVIKGVPRAFPYAEPGTQALGQWNLDLQIAGATLRFSPDWPVARKLSAALHFAANHMHIDVTSAQLDGVKIRQATADLAHFHADPLLVTAAADADLQAWYALLRASPLHGHLRGLVDDSTASGAAHVDLSLDIPLQKERDTGVTGDVRLEDARYQMDTLPVPATAITGHLAFDHDGLTGLALYGNYAGTAVAATLESAQADPTLRFRFRADPAHDPIAALYLPAWLRPHLAGTSTWWLALPLHRGHDWVLESDLAGTAIDLPAPLEKAAATAWPLTVRTTTGATGDRRLHIDAGAPLGLELRYGPAPGPDAGHLAGIGLRIGAGPPVSADEDGLRIAGHFGSLDLDALLATAAAMAGAATTDGTRTVLPPFRGAELTAQTLRWHAARVDGVHARIAPRDSRFDAILDGPGVRGTLTWDPRGPRVKARLERLALAAFSHPDKPRGAAPPHPVMDPNTLPTLDLICNSLTIGTQDLGTLKLVTRRSAAGQALQTATLSGRDAGISATGDWTRQAGESSARLGFAIDAKHLGRFLQAFGYAPTVTAAQAKFTGSVQFPPTSTGLDMSRPTGTVDVHLQDGTLSAVRPGMGRVFGLLNVYALPRRLLHGFKDVANNELAYDRLTAHFTLGNGQARTRDAHIDGPSLNLDVSGRIGLRDHDLDQTVRVYTNVASSVTLGAVLLGGPIAGGVALLAQQLVGKALNQLTELRYRITGPWDDPEVVRLDATSKTAAASGLTPPATTSGQ